MLHLYFLKYFHLFIHMKFIHFINLSHYLEYLIIFIIILEIVFNCFHFISFFIIHLLKYFRELSPNQKSFIIFKYHLSFS